MGTEMPWGTGHMFIFLPWACVLGGRMPSLARSLLARPLPLSSSPFSPSPLLPPSHHLSLCVFLPVYLLPPLSPFFPSLPPSFSLPLICAIQYIPAVLLASLYLENEQ